MTDPSRDQPNDAKLNPALKSRTDKTHDTTTPTPPPLETTEAKEGQGEGWPIVWLVVTVLSVVLAIYFIL
jgi:hypothetical protein